MTASAATAIHWAEQGLLPDRALRIGIRRLLRQRLAELHAGDAESEAAISRSFVARMHEAPLAPLPEKANEQHYELPAAFFATVLGARAKYSSGWWPPGVETLDGAESAALQATEERLGLASGQRVLDLGCGWGAFTLWAAERWPDAQITAVSNAHAQRLHIEARARARGLANVRVITADINRFDPGERFDRIVSIEMFEHLRNWPRMFERVASWLQPDGRFLMHVFVHRGAPYAFVDEGAGDWMSRHFFSGGMMPSDDLALHFQEHLRVEARWRWNGLHYQRTALAWLANMDRQREALMPVLQTAYGAQAGLWWQRWRLFFLAVAELFGFEGGQRWWVSHYLFAPRR